MKFLKEHWILAFSVFLLIFMYLPLLYFGNILSLLDLNQSKADSNLFEIDSRPTVGICLNNLLENRWLKEKAVWLKQANLEQIPVQILIADNSLKRQVRQIKSFIQQKIKVLILVPVSREGLAEVLQEATQRGIKIILYDELTEGPADFYFGADYREMGRLQASLLTEAAGPGRYLLFQGPVDSYKAEMLVKGQLPVLENLVDQGVRISAKVILPGWSAETAVVKTRTFITHQKIKAILAPNDIVANEIIKFFKEQKLLIPLITGSGGEFAAIQSIKSSEQLLTVNCDYTLLAKIAFQYAIALSRGNKFSLPDSVYNNSKRIPAKIFPVRLVTKKTVNS